MLKIEQQQILIDRNHAQVTSRHSLTSPINRQDQTRGLCCMPDTSHSKPIEFPYSVVLMLSLCDGLFAPNRFVTTIPKEKPTNNVIISNSALGIVAARNSNLVSTACVFCNITMETNRVKTIITTAFIFFTVRFSLLRDCSRDTHVYLSGKMSIHGQWNCCILSRRWWLTLSFDC
jgi:hypothetical protein